MDDLPEEYPFSDPFGARVQPPGTPKPAATSYDISTPKVESVEPRSAVASGPSESAKRDQQFDDKFVRANAAAVGIEERQESKRKLLEAIELSLIHI